MNRSTPLRLRSLERDSLPDAELVEHVRGGQRWAEDLLVRRHLPKIAGLAARLLGDPDEAQDVVQDTFATVFAELGALREAAAFEAWVRSVAVHKVHRRFRRRRMLRWLGIGGEPEAGLEALASVEATQEHRAELVFLDRALAQLSIDERLAWCLRYVEGLQLEEVASSCGASLATIKRRIARADVIIRKQVAVEEDLP